MVTSASPSSPEPEWTLNGPSNRNHVEANTEEKEWMRVKPGPSQEIMVREIEATENRKMKYDQIQEWNPTLTRFFSRRQ